MCVLRSALDIAHVINCSCICCERLVFVSGEDHRLVTGHILRMEWAFFRRAFIILVFFVCLFHSSVHVLIWACLQKEEIFGSFHFML